MFWELIAELSNESFGEVESDEGLEGLEIVDEEEDYAFVMVSLTCTLIAKIY
jgi:hypothetical protein